MTKYTHPNETKIKSMRSGKMSKFYLNLAGYSQPEPAMSPRANLTVNVTKYHGG